MDSNEIQDEDWELIIERLSGITKLHRTLCDFADDIVSIQEAMIRFVEERSYFFPLSDYPYATAEEKFTMKTLAWDAQHRTNILYLSSHTPECIIQPHDHQTIAVTVGLDGVEENVLYRKEGNGIVPLATVYIEHGEGIALGPDEIHKIRAVSGPTRTLRYYGKVLADQEGIRTFYDLG